LPRTSLSVWARVRTWLAEWLAAGYRPAYVG